MTLAITGLSLITSVGRDVADSCASIRAGITRPHAIEHFQIVDDETQETIPVIGHPIRGYAEGFNGVGLWTRLAKKCVHDLFDDLRIEEGDVAAFWGRTALIGATPYVDDDRFQSSGDETPDLLRDSYLRPLVDDLELPIPTPRLHAVCKGHAATIAAVALAETMLIRMDLDRALVLAIDSFLDTLTLEWLADHDRLKSPVNPVGLMPGEAGACLLLERPDSADRRGARIWGLVEGTSLAREVHDVFSGEPNRGLGLAEAIRLALSTAATDSFRGDVIADLNGEEWRAVEFAGARLLLDGTVDRGCSVVIPALSIGDVGAASGAVSIAVAIQSFARGYASGNRTLVVSSSDHGDVGATFVRRPD